MSKPVVLVKHSLPEIIGGLSAREWKLSEEGRARAERLAHQLTRFQPGLIVSSDEPKARETAEIISRVHQLDVSIHDGLHEHERNSVPFLPPDEFEDSIREFFQKPDQIIFGTESADQAHARFSQVVHLIVESNVGKSLVIVAHGTVISLFVSRLTGLSDFMLWKELGLPSFVVLDLNAKTITARENNI